MSELNVKPILKQFLLSITGNDIMRTNNNDYGCIDRFLDSERFDKALKQANGVTTGDGNCNIPLVSDWLSDFPENTPLYKDSGRWQLRTDDMEDIIIDQGLNESDKDFIERCKAYR